MLLYPAARAFDGLRGVQGISVTKPVAYATALVLQRFYFQRVWKRSPIARLA